MNWANKAVLRSLAVLLGVLAPGGDTSAACDTNNRFAFNFSSRPETQLAYGSTYTSTYTYTYIYIYTYIYTYTASTPSARHVTLTSRWSRA